MEEYKPHSRSDEEYKPHSRSDGGIQASSAKMRESGQRHRQLASAVSTPSVLVSDSDTPHTPSLLVSDSDTPHTPSLLVSDSLLVSLTSARIRLSRVSGPGYALHSVASRVRIV